MERLFVYGSLQPGASNAHVMADVEGDWEPAVVHGRLLQAGWGAEMGYPGLVLDEGGPEVAGHVLSSSQLGPKWAELDAFEGEEYRRVEAMATLVNDRRVRVFVYVIRSSAPRRLADS